MVFLIEPERTITGPMPRAYVVKFVSFEHKKKTKKPPDKRIAIPRPSSNPELTPTRTNIPQKTTPTKIAVHIPGIGAINVYSVERAKTLDLDMGAEEKYSPNQNSEVLFNQAERKYLQSRKEKPLPPERIRIPGGGEIDRIGDTCFEVSSAGGSGSSDAGQTAVGKDQNFAMRSLSARQVPCNKIDNSFAQDFLKQLEERKMVTAPVAATN